MDFHQIRPELETEVPNDAECAILPGLAETESIRA
jgi:hypothetical protein